MSLDFLILAALYSFLVVSALGIVISANPVQAILFLVLSFINTAGLFIFAGAEFLGLVLVVVYVGAVAVLFLFVCMMLNIRVEALGWATVSHLPFGALVLIFLTSTLLPVVYAGFVEGAFSLPVPGEAPYADWATALDASQNAVALASVLYSIFSHYFVFSAFILLLAMVGSIVLTLWRRTDAKRQNIYYQINRDTTKARLLGLQF